MCGRPDDNDTCRMRMLVVACCLVTTFTTATPQLLYAQFQDIAQSTEHSVRPCLHKPEPRNKYICADTFCSILFRIFDAVQIGCGSHLFFALSQTAAVWHKVSAYDKRGRRLVVLTGTGTHAHTHTQTQTQHKKTRTHASTHARTTHTCTHWV